MRLASLDVFRGITIAAMILVNMSGLSEEAYSPLNHAAWDGWTLADLVFPFFLFITGAAMSFSLARHTVGRNGNATALYLRILRRCAILFLLGLLLNGFYTYDFQTIRLMGVLQRIGIAYLLSSLLILNSSRKQQWIIAALILIGYWLVMCFVPVPGYGPGILDREGNLGAYMDRLLIGKDHLYKGDSFNSMGDPEGLFATLPSVVTVLMGYFTGEWLRHRKVGSQTSMELILMGLILLVAGQLWDLVFPINKKLWTSSYVLLTNGCALVLMAVCYEWIEVRQRRRWFKSFEIMGLNAIFIFVASVLLIKIMVKSHVGNSDNAPTVYDWIYTHFFSVWAHGPNASLFFALTTLILWWGVAWMMYRRDWFLKV